jgi:hypothetical protein
LFHISTSAGNAEGLGALRKQEIYYSCSVLGIERDSVTVIDDTRLPDGMAAGWPVEVVNEHVEAAIRRYSASIVSYKTLVTKFHVLIFSIMTAWQYDICYILSDITVDIKLIIIFCRSLLSIAKVYLDIKTT